MRTFKQIIHYFLYYFWRIAFFLKLYTPPPKPKTYLDENAAFIEPLKTRFLQSFENKNIDYEYNINPIFYSKKEYDIFMTEANNSLERIWKTRMLWENTPRGNVIMFYDPYKMAFAFYCDQKVISYDILNAIAMKYVIIFRCRHFFLDESIVPQHHTSPFIKIHFSEDVKTTQTKEVKKTFAKLRDYTKENPNTKLKTNVNTEPEKKQNTFLYLGKTTNFDLLQRQPKPKRVLAKFTSPLLEGLQQNTAVQKEVMSYKDYKKVVKIHDPEVI
jgi:hypothetical protein